MIKALLRVLGWLFVLAGLLVVVGVVAIFTANEARAEGESVPKLSGYQWGCVGNTGLYGVPKQYGPSPEAACGAAFTGESTPTYDGWVTRWWTQHFTRCDPQYGPVATPEARCFGYERRHSRNDAGAYSSTDTGFSSVASATLQTGCPANSTEQAGVCKCIAAHSPSDDGKSCVPNPCQFKRVASSGFYDIGPNAGASPALVGCKGGCEVFFDGESPAGSSMVGGVKHWYAKGSYSESGKRCTAAQQAAKPISDSTATKPADTCAAGQGTATMNGKTVCVDQNTDKPTPESEDKSTTKTEKTTTTNPDGSTTTTETTTKTDGQGNKEVTVIRTTTRPDGSTSVESETTGGVKPPGTGTDDGQDDGNDDERGECEKNPSAAGCGGEPAPVGELYTPKQKTMAGVLSSARDTFMSSPVGSAVGGFFVVSGGGSCPTWNAQIPYLDVQLTIDQFCSSFASTALALFKAALLVVASFFAFRIAVE